MADVMTFKYLLSDNNAVYYMKQLIEVVHDSVCLRLTYFFVINVTKNNVRVSFVRIRPYCTCGLYVFVTFWSLHSYIHVFHNHSMKRKNSPESWNVVDS